MSSSADLGAFFSALASQQSEESATSRRATRTRASTLTPQSDYTVVTYEFTKTGGLLPSVYTTLITNPLIVDTSSATATSQSSSVETSQSSREQSSTGPALPSAASSSASAGALTGQDTGSSSGSSSSGISGGAIAAAVIVPIIAIAALITGIIFFLRRRKQQHRLSSASTVQSFSNEPPPQMAMAERPRDSAGPPTLNHIVPGELEKEIAVPAATATANTSRWSDIWRGPSAISRKSVAGSTATPQIGEDVFRPVSPIHDTPAEAPRDPFATPTPASLANSPEDTPNYLNANGTPIRKVRSNELFTDPTPDTAAVGRQWHSTNGSSRFNGRDPRMSPVGERESRPMSTADDVSDLDEDETVEIGEATVATTSTAHRQRASMIDMARLEGSPPTESHI